MFAKPIAKYPSGNLDEAPRSAIEKALVEWLPSALGAQREAVAAGVSLLSESAGSRGACSIHHTPENKQDQNCNGELRSL